MATNVTRLVEVDSLFFQDNVRSPECLEIPQIVKSFKIHGFQVNHPLVVSEKEDGRYLVLCGNRRGIGLQWLRENEPKEYDRILAGTNYRIPAVVHKGLTPHEETLLRIDHSDDLDRVPLDEWSIFLAIRQLVMIGDDTQERIAEKLSINYTKGKNKGQPNRSYIQPRVNLARLPSFVQDEIRKYTLDKDSTALRWSHVAGLYKAYNAEFVDHPDANGPKFQEAWKAALTPPEPKEPKDKTGHKDLSATDAVKRAQAASSKMLSTALLSVTGQSDTSLADIDKAMVEGEDAISTLSAIKDYLGEKDFTDLVNSALEQKRVVEEETTDSSDEEVSAVA